MDLIVTFRAEGDQVVFNIVSRLAAQHDVVYLQARPLSTCLASPAVPLQHLLTQLLVRFRVKLSSGPPVTIDGHAISARSPVRN